MYWLIPTLLTIYALIFIGIIPYIRNQRINRFRETMKEGDLCRVYYGEETYLGTLKSCYPIWNAVSFLDTEDYPHDKEGHKILSVSRKMEEIYPA